MSKTIWVERKIITDEDKDALLALRDFLANGTPILTDGGRYVRTGDGIPYALLYAQARQEVQRIEEKYR